MIKIIEGNLFDSKAQIICHQVNCQGRMGSGVAKQVRERYPTVYGAYMNEYKNGSLKLGAVVYATAKRDQVIANMCAQDNFGYDGRLYTNYAALQECLNDVNAYAYTAFDVKPTIAFPYNLGCGLGGGSWNVVYKMIEETFKNFDVEIWRLDEGE